MVVAERVEKVDGDELDGGIWRVKERVLDLV